MTKKTPGYTSKDILVLSDRDHVRKRTNVYFGSMTPTTFTIPIFGEGSFSIETVTVIPAMLKAFGEIVDNAVDELTKHKSSNKRIDITYDKGRITVSDNGRGVPIDKHEVGLYTPEVVFSQLRSGRNFDDNNKTTGVIGVNGVGSSCTNMCSTFFSVTIKRDGKVYTQTFKDGAAVISKPSIKPSKSLVTGTEVIFELDPQIFGKELLPEAVIRNRAYEVALTNPNIMMTFNGEKIKMKGGFQELAKQQAAPYHKFTTTKDDEYVIEVIVIPNQHDGRDEQMFTWVNSSLLYDGGICNTQFVNALTEKVITYLTPKAKKQKSEVGKDDVRKGVLIFANIMLRAPEYDNQAKTRLTGPNLRKPLVDMVENDWSAFTRKTKDWLEEVLERAVSRFHHRENNRATKEHRQSSKRVEGLLDATSKDRSQCVLFVTEGDSAKATISQARTPEFHGAFPLRGKLNNVHHSTPAQVLAMEKVSDLLLAIGLTPGYKADPTTMRFGYIILSCDADTDGAHITTLLVQLLFKFWPELFDKKHPRVFRLMTPNVIAVKGDQRIHFNTQAEFLKQADKYKSWQIKYCKGLGSLTHQDWKMVLQDLSSSCHVFYDDGKLKDTLALHFSDDVTPRREWLMKDRS